MAREAVPLKTRIQEGYRVAPTGCWEWAGTKDSKGYGVLKVYRDGGKKTIKAHRVSWTVHRGPIPDSTSYHGTMVLHNCDNPSCINPRHLRLGTAKDNAIDREVRGRSNRRSSR